MFAKSIHHYNFIEYGHTVRSGDDVQFLREYKYEEITPENTGPIYRYSEPVYIEPAQGVGVLYVTKNIEDEPVSFIFSRPICINPGIWFCVTPMACKFSYHLFHKNGFMAKDFDTLKYRVVYNQKVICSNLYTALYQEKSKNFVFKGESHPFWEVIYIDVGSMMCTIGETQVELLEGTIAFIPQDVFHALYSTTKMVSFVTVTFDLQSEDESLLKNKVFNSNKITHSYFQQIVAEFNNNGKYSGDLILNYLNLIVLNLLSNNKEDESGAVHSFFYNSEASLILKKAEMIVDDEIFNIELSVAYVAKKLNISTSYLFRCFKQQYNTGLSEYICVKKLEKAKKMIVDGELTLAEIGMALNFCSQTYFTSCFKKRYRMTPSQYSKSVFRK